MKPFIIIALAMFSIDGIAGNVGAELLATPTQTRITKTRGGLRGFKTVTEDIKPGQYANLACADPGNVQCKFKNPPQIAVTDLSPGDLENIDSRINESISGGILSSHFTYTGTDANKYLVVFEAIAEMGTIEYTVYTTQEATALGYEI